MLTLTAAPDGRTVLAETLRFRGNPTPREQAPQLPDRIFRDEAGVIPVVSDGAYTFTVGPGDADDILIQAVDLVLRSAAGEVDERLQPVGFSLMAIGFVGLILALRRRQGRQARQSRTRSRRRRAGAGWRHSRLMS